MRGGADTIVAVATPGGEGGIGIVRLSGPDAAAIGEKLFRPRKAAPRPWPSHQLLYGKIVDPADGSALDEGFGVRMEAPHSYTGEEVVELQGHGSCVTLRKIVTLATALGARPAEPGEFTKRAFLNGKIDLLQAEAVAELIAARSEAEARSARLRLEGKLSGVLARLREETVALLAECEADVDFPEEGLSLAKRPQLQNKLKQIQQVTTELRLTYDANRRLFGGFVVALIGRPNVGKSSLFNALLANERAIVTPHPGTTRDILREELLLNGRRVRLVDTAGLHFREADLAEQLGMERASKECAQADLVCLVADASVGTMEEDLELFGRAKGKRWWIWNKIDLGRAAEASAGADRVFAVSATRGDGLSELRGAVGEAASSATEVSSEGGIANDRQRDLLDRFSASLECAGKEWGRGASPEFVAFELRQAHRCLSRMIGKDEDMEEVLGQIFSRFCIGK